MFVQAKCVSDTAIDFAGKKNVRLATQLFNYFKCFADLNLFFIVNNFIIHICLDF